MKGAAALLPVSGVVLLLSVTSKVPTVKVPLTAKSGPSVTPGAKKPTREPVETALPVAWMLVVARQSTSAPVSKAMLFSWTLSPEQVSSSRMVTANVSGVPRTAPPVAEDRVTVNS